MGGGRLKPRNRKQGTKLLGWEQMWAVVFCWICLGTQHSWAAGLCSVQLQSGVPVVKAGLVFLRLSLLYQASFWKSEHLWQLTPPGCCPCLPTALVTAGCALRALQRRHQLGNSLRTCQRLLSVGCIQRGGGWAHGSAIGKDPWCGNRG